MKRTLNIATAALTGLVLINAPGCDTGEQTGTLAGAGIGALAGQAIGGDTTGTLVGAGIGALVGNRIGAAEDDKDRQRTDAQRQQEQQRRMDDQQRQIDAQQREIDRMRNE